MAFSRRELRIHCEQSGHGARDGLRFRFPEGLTRLRPGGVSINQFPVREVLWEGHALMPLVHRIKHGQARARLILLFAKAGFRGEYRRKPSGADGDHLKSLRRCSRVNCKQIRIT
jgi:hypothetical protein